MKVNIPKYVVFASNFTIESILESIINISYDMLRNPDKNFSSFYKLVEYKESPLSKPIEIGIAQTHLIDLVYAITCMRKFGDKAIDLNNTYKLIGLYTAYADQIDSKRIKSTEQAYLNVYAFFGEQAKFQNLDFFNEFAREKYITDLLSVKHHPNNNYNIDFCKQFKQITGFTTDEYSAILFAINNLLCSIKPKIKIEQIDFLEKVLGYKNRLLKVFVDNSVKIPDIADSPLKRQIFYSKPFIQINDSFIPVNSCLLLSWFANSNYWIMRNHYYNKSSDNQKFINAFGVYFEMYVEELLNNCLAENNYERITECGRKRADWKLQLGDYEFLVEQKSSLSLLGIKQTQPDIKKFKEHIIKCWGKAVIQLNETEKDLKLSSPIKIILLYEDYYKSECLDLLFEYDDYVDYYDRKYWLVTINEFEMLIKLYKDNPELFFTIIEEKDKSELNESNDGREPLRFLRNHGIYSNSYLEEFHIYDQFTKVQNLTQKHQ